MSLPPAFLDELRDRLTLSDVVGRKVTWDRRKSNPAKGDFWAPCPFHQEKTPSFHVDDRKGFYYCFGCHVKGDMITFVKETENLSFIESVELLAREAGVEMPAETRDPQAAERRSRHERLVDVMEQAIRLFGLAFRSGAGQGARDYARQRRLSDETLARFEIGYAPDSRNHLAGHFREKGLLAEAIAAGLVIEPDGGGTPYDRFRGRLMFPIRDPRGRCIAFGGRALSDGQTAKYLNSPETELFHKGRTLFNSGPARDAAGKTGSLIVAEGYMDVIALAMAGFDHSVAPLGTAITEEQLGLLWRIAPEPVIALDGDAAGLRAANRLIDLALPMIGPGRSLRFCLLPEGRDPDDLIQAEGPSAMQAALDDAVPLVEMLWRRESGREPLDTPERRAALDARLRAAISQIADRGVKSHYGEALRDRRAALFKPARTAQPHAGGRGRPGARSHARQGASGPMRETLGSELARRGAARNAEARIRESAILLIACRNPEALGRVEGALETMTCLTSEIAAIRDALIDALAAGDEPVAHISTVLSLDPIGVLSSVPQARAHPMARPGSDATKVAMVLEEAIARHQAQLGFADELSEATREIATAETEDWTVRVRQAGVERAAADAAVVERAAREPDDAAGMIQRMLDEKVYLKKKRHKGSTNQ